MWKPIHVKFWEVELWDWRRWGEQVQVRQWRRKLSLIAFCLLLLWSHPSPQLLSDTERDHMYFVAVRYHWIVHSLSVATTALPITNWNWFQRKHWLSDSVKQGNSRKINNKYFSFSFRFKALILTYNTRSWTRWITTQWPGPSWTWSLISRLRWQRIWPTIQEQCK